MRALVDFLEENAICSVNHDTLFLTSIVGRMTICTAIMGTFLQIVSGVEGGIGQDCIEL